jgi:hypothetical protein
MEIQSNIEKGNIPLFALQGFEGLGRTLFLPFAPLEK